MYPYLSIDLNKLEKNIRSVTEICRAHDVCVTAVTKGVCGDPEIARIFTDAGIGMLGDSRIQNLKRLQRLPAEKWLIRPPMPCETEETVRFADVSVNTELSVIEALDRNAGKLHKRHKIILMADLGDLREGFVDEEELLGAAEAAERLEHVELYGIGTNLTCFSFIKPDAGKMERLAGLASHVEQRIGRKLSIVSGGNSATMDLLMTEGLPERINHLRLGEAFLFGRERVNYRYLPGTCRDVFTLECQIVELKIKPSLPWGETGADSYGRKPQYTDRGERRLKAVCALGKQDFDVETCEPEDPDIVILGASSDHLVLDVTDSKREYQAGGIVKLKLGYFSTLRAFTSEYVTKVYERDSLS